MGIAACDQVLARVTACSLLKCPGLPSGDAKAQVFARAMWDVEHHKLVDGGDRKAIEAECDEQAQTWDDRFARSRRLLM